MNHTLRIAFRFDTGLDLRLLIARVTGAPVHCCIVYGDDICSDVSFSGARFVALADRTRNGEWQVLQAPATLYDPIRGRILAATRLGWEYDWWGAIAAWWLGRTGGRGAARKLFCSEACADELRASGVPLMHSRTARYTPRKLYDELREYHGWERV